MRPSMWILPTSSSTSLLCAAIRRTMPLLTLFWILQVLFCGLFFHSQSAAVLNMYSPTASGQCTDYEAHIWWSRAGNHVQWCKQEELASALQILCSELLKTQRDRVHFPDITISPHRQRAADLACQEHCRVLLAIYRLLQTYRRALTEQSRTIGNNLSGVQNEQASK